MSTIRGPIRHRNRLSDGPYLSALRCAIAGGGFALLLMAAPLAAEPVFVGGSGLPEVDINFEALDQNRPAPYRPRLLYPGATRPALAPVRLRPPGSPQADAAPRLAPTSGGGTSDRIILTPPGRAPATPKARAAAPRPAPKPARLTGEMAASAAPQAETPQAETSQAEMQQATLPSADGPGPSAPATTPEPKATESAPVPKATNVAPTPPPAPPAAVSAPPPPQVASLPPARAAVGDDTRIGFTADQAALDDAGKKRLSELAAELQGRPEKRLQIKAYADGTAETASQARRLSLSRALAVRSFLIEQGIESTRMDVRALGSKFEEGPPDRVDAVMVDQ